MMLALLLAAALADTVPLLPAAYPLTFDGLVSAEEYGAPSLEIPRPGGIIRVWLRRDGGFVYLAGAIPDSSFYWGDDLVVSLDVHGDRETGPGHFAFQWYLRRVLDSSIVYRGDGGHWRAPQDDPDWKLGAAREGGGWEVRSRSDSAGWSIELRFDAEYFAPPAGRSTGLALRTYNDIPHGWFIWPRPPGIRQPTELERRPDLWAVVSAPSGS